MWNKIRSKWYDFLWWVSGPHAGRLHQEMSKEFLEVHDMLMEEKMTGKRFQIDGMHVRDLNGIIPSTIWQIDEFKQKFCDELNKLHEENLQLKQRIKELEQGD